MKTWTDAQIYCKARYVDLATIETSDEINRLLNVAHTKNFTSDAWIGLYYDVAVDWHWSLTNGAIGTETNWCSYNMATYSCSLITPTCWEMHPCDCTHYFVCYDSK